MHPRIILTAVLLVVMACRASYPRVSTGRLRGPRGGLSGEVRRPVAYSHSSTLKSIEEIFGVGLLRGAADPATNDFADLFAPGFFP